MGGFLTYQIITLLAISNQKCYFVSIRRYIMANNVDKTLTALAKLYDKRAALDRQILTAEKTLAAAAGESGTPKKAAAKKAASAKKAVAKKTAPKE